MNGNLNKRLKMMCLLFFMALSGCTELNQIFSMPDDNPVEEAVEILIDEEFDVEIDLTP